VAKLLPLPVARFAALSVARDFDTLLRVGWLPALINTVVGTVLESRLITEVPGSDQIEINFGPLAVYVLTAIATQTIFAVAWHRCVLLGETRPGQRFYLRFARREAIYALAALVVTAVALMGLYALPVVTSLIAAGQALPALIMLGAPLMALVLIARLCLVLPMVALDRRVDPAKSWQAVAGNTWRVVAVLLLVGLPVFVAEYILISIVGSVALAAATALGDVGDVVSFVAFFIAGLVVLSLLAVILSAVSLVYAVLAGDDTLKARLPAPVGTFAEP